MNARKRLMRMQQATPAQITELFPLPEGKKELFNYRGEVRRWNVGTGKYDIKV